MSEPLSREREKEREGERERGREVKEEPKDSLNLTCTDVFWHNEER